MIREYNIDVKKLEKLFLSIKSFLAFEVDKMNVYALLFQTGYLTIKEIIRNDLEKEYVLSYPNKEVRKSFEILVKSDKYKEMNNHKDLDVWKKSIDLSKKVYLLTKSFPKEEIYGLINQIRMSSVLIPSNIAERTTR